MGGNPRRQIDGTKYILALSVRPPFSKIFSSRDESRYAGVMCPSATPGDPQAPGRPSVMSGRVRVEGGRVTAPVGSEDEISALG